MPRFFERIFPVLLALWPIQAIAQDPACTYGTEQAFQNVSESYAGIWSVMHQKGFVSSGGMILPFGNDPDGPETVTIFLMDDQLVMTHPQAQESMELTWANEPVWTFEGDAANDGVPEPLLSSEDIELLMGCKNDKMARLIGKSKAVVDGMTMEFTYRLMIVGETAMYGVMHMQTVAQGYPVNVWRSVALTR